MIVYPIDATHVVETSNLWILVRSKSKSNYLEIPYGRAT